MATIKKTPLRFAFGCEARVGKDTACDYLMTKNRSYRHSFSGNCQRFSFAGALYDILYHAQRTCGFPEVKDRKFLQWVGTEWARAQDPDVWVNIVRRKIQSLADNTPVIVSDVRFSNEATMLKELGFTLIRITRDSTLRGESPNTHTSEVGLLNYDWDVVIENNGSLEEFYRKLDKL